MIRLELNVGRLIEITSEGILTPEDVQRFQSDMIRLAPRFETIDRVLGCTDLRAARPSSAAISAQMRNLMLLGHGRLEREATLLGTDPVVALQARRMAEEAHHPGRRVCTTVTEAIAWLEPVATPAELSRARQFLAGKST